MVERVIRSWAKRWADIPPVWLLLAMALVWGQGQVLPLGPGIRTWVPAWAVWVLWAGAAGLTLAAVKAMRRANTSLHPHDNADKLVTDGVFRLSRNPIYVADVLVLLSAVIWFGTWASLGVLALFIWLLQHRFIRAEERRLQDRFPEDWAIYAKRTRRWV